jgi:hypothetical protein
MLFCNYLLYIILYTIYCWHYLTYLILLLFKQTSQVSIIIIKEILQFLGVIRYRFDIVQAPWCDPFQKCYYCYKYLACLFNTLHYVFQYISYYVPYLKYKIHHMILILFTMSHCCHALSICNRKFVMYIEIRIWTLWILPIQFSNLGYINLHMFHVTG